MKQAFLGNAIAFGLVVVIALGTVAALAAGAHRPPHHVVASLVHASLVHAGTVHASS
ncbi:hypothetical protein SAMN06265365_12933 [Tistlia consotensis]|uniref:Uncharacterized protein n=1 Tax=Tistlia consotensis USBA 355 TaxID=560819 RepID=A0A1Y6CLF6_9PROT|nr:hypothetical protein [Tistlia consotensis]SMF75492.1 hypothetical protein SAMN05428998_13433 [Tistlia consotensis USBA 355]SNS07939.1 hypothetical protein SAMN06265365_12933 [Tistlia consotensis]